MQNAIQNDKSVKPFAAFLLWLYIRLLRFYPAIFRTSFEAEMIDVFSITLRDSAGQLGLALTFWHEVRGLPFSLLDTHHQAFHQLPVAMRRLQQTRWFVRIIAGLLGIFLLSTLRVIFSPNFHLYIQAIPFAVLLGITSISLLAAICWERWGGLLTGSSGVMLGIFMAVYLMQIAASVEVSILGGFLWMLPFVIFGALFHQLSWRSTAM